MLKLFTDKDAEAVILGTRVSDDAAKNFGCIVSDTHTKRVLHYVEKPESHISNLINCGVYLFATEAIFPSIKTAIKRRTDRPPRLVSYPSSDNLENSYVLPTNDDDDDEEKKNEVIRLEQDILGDMADSKQFFVYETKDFWRQIKTAGSAVPANALYLQRAWQAGSDELAEPSANIVPPVFIHPTAQIHPTAKLGPNVSIGPRVVIGAGARVKETVVLEDCEIKHDACVLYSIIGWGSRVGAWARVEGTPTPVGSHSTSIIKNGVKVQSCTILGKDCGVGDEVRVQNCVCLPYKELKRVRTAQYADLYNRMLIHIATGCGKRGHHVRAVLVMKKTRSRKTFETLASGEATSGSPSSRAQKKRTERHGSTARRSWTQDVMRLRGDGHRQRRREKENSTSGDLPLQIGSQMNERNYMEQNMFLNAENL